MRNRVTRVVSVCCVLSAVCWLLAASASAQVPRLIRYQGQAVDGNGVPLEGPYMLTFRLYDAATTGVKVWEESQANVTLSKGHFSILLGSATPLDPVDWSKDLWLSIQVGTEAELSPRQRLTSVPLALRAETAERLAGAATDVSANVYSSTRPSIPNSTFVRLTFDSERWDTNTIHDPAVNNYRLTAKTAGKYYVYFACEWGVNATGMRYAGLSIASVNNNGTFRTITPAFVDPPGTYSLLSGYVNFAAGDYLEVAVWQNSGGSVSVVDSVFGMVKVP